MNNQAWLGSWVSNSDWTTRVPEYESQYSTITHTDYEDCTCMSLVHVIYCITGRRYSARALATLAQVTPQGAWCIDVLNAANKYGLIPYELWSDDAVYDWNGYYAPIPQEVLDKADKLPLSLVPSDLNVSPLWTEIEFNSNMIQPGPFHMVCQINGTQYFDSEVGAPIKTIVLDGQYPSKVPWSSSVVVGLPDHYTTETSDPVTTSTQTINP